MLGENVRSDGASPEPFFEPIASNHPRPAFRGGDTYKVVALNARGGAGIETIVARLQKPPLAGADAILLCEMDWRLGRSGQLEVPAQIARRLSLSFAFQPMIGFARDDGPINSFFGVAILSARPLQNVRAIPIPIGNQSRAERFRKPARHYRSVFSPAGLAAQIDLKGKELTLGVIHLDSRSDPAGRERQMLAYLSAFPDAAPAVIGGDFNTTTIDLGALAQGLATLAFDVMRKPQRLREPRRYEPLFARIEAAGFATSGINKLLEPTFTFSRFWPLFLRPRLDWLAARALEPVLGSATVVASRRHAFAPRISDHDFIVCDFKI